LPRPHRSEHGAWTVSACPVLGYFMLKSALSLPVSPFRLQFANTVPPLLGRNGAMNTNEAYRFPTPAKQARTF
jgi:hypothetical protein